MKEQFRRLTGYQIDNTHPNPIIKTYWHIYDQVSEDEYYRNYAEWLEVNCEIMAKHILSIHL
tara:strand:- start:4310 stop:4495 length:186 start_codon:yes stop_codon:yes gene_type:complete